VDADRALRALFAVAVIDHSENGIIVRVNPLMCELSGWSEDELVGQPLELLIPKQSRQAHHFYRMGFMLRPSPRPMGPDREVVLLHRTGHEIRVWVGLAPIEEGGVLAVVLPMDIGRSFGLPSYR
jgi:PAS domain S-box-containing protein